jgi:hypothetical protein
MEFALETASRRGEVVCFGPQHIRAGRIRIERTHGSADVDIPISPELEAACAAMPKAHLTYVVTTAGQPRSKYGLGNDFAKWATEAGLPARCRLHGLKKSALARLAEEGASIPSKSARRWAIREPSVEQTVGPADMRTLPEMIRDEIAVLELFNSPAAPIRGPDNLSTPRFPS